MINKYSSNICDPRSIIAVVLKLTDDGLYQLGCNAGVLKQLYSRSQFTVCSENLLAIEPVPNESVTLRSAATTQSLGTGQGFFKCTCTKKCDTKRCVCRKNEVLCNSKCHNSLTCTNK